jgi:5-methylcytosine-specific restriction endonuclease McrA
MQVILPSGKLFELKDLPRRIGYGFGCVARRNRRERESGNGWSRVEWSELLQKYDGKCVCCGSLERIVPDHVVPLKRGGVHSLSNIQPLCWKCNTRKGLQIIDYRPLFTTNTT